MENKKEWFRINAKMDPNEYAKVVEVVREKDVKLGVWLGEAISFYLQREKVQNNVGQIPME